MIVMMMTYFEWFWPSALIRCRHRCCCLSGTTGSAPAATTMTTGTASWRSCGCGGGSGRRRRHRPHHPSRRRDRQPSSRVGAEGSSIRLTSSSDCVPRSRERTKPFVTRRVLDATFEHACRYCCRCCRRCCCCHRCYCCCSSCCSCCCCCCRRCCYCSCCFCCHPQAYFEREMTGVVRYSTGKMRT